MEPPATFEAPGAGPPAEPGGEPREYLGHRLDRFQEEAIDGIERGLDVIVAAPTGAGKTLIAHFAIEKALREGKRVIYTAPIKALSNQKFRDLTEAFPGQVGISTGDVSIEAGAPAVIMTTEIFRNTIFDDPKRVSEVAWVIFDEVHFLDDPDRGTVWEESLIFCPPGVRILALSATVSNLDELAAWIGEVRGAPPRVVVETRRPVPLDVHVVSPEGTVRELERIRELRPKRQHQERWERRGERASGRDRMAQLEKSWRKLVQSVADRGDLPLLFFLFSRDACERLARACIGVRLATKEQARACAAEFSRLARAFELDRADQTVGLMALLAEHGIAFHHAGLLPALKEVVERLFTAGHVRLLCATETFALGINMPARAVAFEGIRKFDGKERVPLKTREYQQMAGRAGRRGKDERGFVYLSYDPTREEPSVYTTLVHGKVEPVESQFNLSYGTLISLWGRLGDRLHEACERSFASFKARRKAGDRAQRKAEGRAGEAPLVARGPAGQEAEGPRRAGKEPLHPFDRPRIVRAGEAPDPDAARFEHRAGRGHRERDERQRGGRLGDHDRHHGHGRHDDRSRWPRGRRGRPGRHEREQRRGPGDGPRDGQPPAPAAPVRGGARYQGIVEQVRLRLEVLRRTGCIDPEGHVTARGKFAQQVFGHELEMATLVFDRVLDGLSPEQTAVVVTAVVFESRKNTYYGGPDPGKLVGIPVFRQASRALHDLWRLETERGVKTPIKLLDWALSGVAWAWVNGAEFAELRELTDASDGDIVRTLRQAIQVLRLCQRPLRSIGRSDLAVAFGAAQGLLKRGLVDAEWQLRKGAELEAPLPAPPEPEPARRPRAGLGFADDEGGAGDAPSGEGGAPPGEDAFDAGIWDDDEPRPPPAAGDEVAGAEVAGDEVAGDEVAGAEVAGDEEAGAAGDEVEAGSGGATSPGPVDDDDAFDAGLRD